jgi:hypothetical protein
MMLSTPLIRYALLLAPPRERGLLCSTPRDRRWPARFQHTLESCLGDIVLDLVHATGSGPIQGLGQIAEIERWREELEGKPFLILLLCLLRYLDMAQLNRFFTLVLGVTELQEAPPSSHAERLARHPRRDQARKGERDYQGVPDY